MHTHLGALSTVEAYFDVSDGPIFLDEVDCTGTETNILQCPSDEPGLHNCIHSEDSGVICQGGSQGAEIERIAPVLPGRLNSSVWVLPVAPPPVPPPPRVGVAGPS